MVYLSIDGEEIMSTSPEIAGPSGKWPPDYIPGSRFQTERHNTGGGQGSGKGSAFPTKKNFPNTICSSISAEMILGKISICSVDVTKYMMIHRYSKIMHICSQVESNIRSDCDGLSAIESVLPAGTLSGAPKIRACEIIEELESEQRGIYGGALGYLDFTGNLDTCIAIRMAVKKDGHVYVQAGGGIVADSIPENEYMESYNKALAVMNAVKNAKEVLE